MTFTRKEREKNTKYFFQKNTSNIKNQEYEELKINKKL